MLRALLVPLLLLVLPSGYASAEVPPAHATNAALLYWQAFAQLPRLSNAEEQKLLEECLTMPLDAHARELVEKSSYSLKMMHRAAAIKPCDWELDYRGEGIETRLPNALASRVLTALACLRARLRMEEGRKAEAMEDLVDAMTLGRQVSAGGVLILVLMSYNIEQRLEEALARFLPQWDAATVRELQKRMAALPPGERPATAMKIEEEAGMDWLARRFKEKKDLDGMLQVLGFLLLQEGEDREHAKEKARAFLEAAGGTREGVLKKIDETRSVYQRMAEKLDLPLDQFEKEFASETEKNAGNPVFKTFFPALVKVRQAQARMEVRRALFAAALAVRLDGPGSLKEHPDPVMGGTFEQVSFEGGFELRSRMKGKDDKPLVLIVGQRGK